VKKKTIYYVGKRYMTALDHEKYGYFSIAEDGAVSLPVPYADRLIQESPWLFSEEAPKQERKNTGSDYEKQPWFALKKYATDRGVDVNGKRKETIIAELVALDAKETEK
jgi:hypothetical protein